MKKYLLSAMAAAIAAVSANVASAQEITMGLVGCCADTHIFFSDTTRVITDLAKQNGVTLHFDSARETEQDDVTLQRKLVMQMINEKKAKVVLVALAKGGRDAHKQLLNAVKPTGVPLVAFTRLSTPQLLKQYNNFYYVGSDAAQAGTYQGEMILEQYKKNPQWDKNKDGIIQYAIVKGPNGEDNAEKRTKWVESTMKGHPELKINAERIALVNADWLPQPAKEAVIKWIDTGLIKDIEVIISNNDGMTIGILEAFKEKGIRDYPPIFSIEGLPNIVQEVIDGNVAGTVLLDRKLHSQVAYKIADNLARGKDPKDGLDDVQFIGREVRIPHR